MSERSFGPITPDAFLAWHERQKRGIHYEFVGGIPVAMVAAKRRHGQIVVNALGLMSGKHRQFTKDITRPELIHWSRTRGGNWLFQVVERLEAELHLPDLGLKLPLPAFYAGLELRARPQLVVEHAP